MEKFKLVTYIYNCGTLQLYIRTLIEFNLFLKFFEDWGVKVNSTTLLETSPRRKKGGVLSYTKWPKNTEFQRLGKLRYYVISINVLSCKEEFYYKFTKWMRENNYKPYIGSYRKSVFTQPSNIAEFYGEI